MGTNNKTAREQAVADIKAELQKHSKSFITFRRELNPAMRKLVSKHLKAQHDKAALAKADYLINNYIDYLGDE